MSRDIRGGFANGRKAAAALPGEGGRSAGLGHPGGRAQVLRSPLPAPRALPAGLPSHRPGENLACPLGRPRQEARPGQPHSHLPQPPAGPRATWAPPAAPTRARNEGLQVGLPGPSLTWYLPPCCLPDGAPPGKDGLPVLSPPRDFHVLTDSGIRVICSLKSSSADRCRRRPGLRAL